MYVFIVIFIKIYCLLIKTYCILYAAKKNCFVQSNDDNYRL